ncbi:MAG: hypothetical protein U1E62_10590 [Alsobacter sp.]
MSEISSATAEQAGEIDEMSQAVAHMDEMTQQNAALAEESAASAGALTGQIETLNQLVATFRTRAGQRIAAGGMAAPAVRAPAPSMQPKPRATRTPPSRPTPAPRPVSEDASHAQTAGNEPDRLRRLAAEAFAAPAPRPAAKAAHAARRAAPSAAGWEEF